jgi:periplasmic divalent cation tolerance protein
LNDPNSITLVITTVASATDAETLAQSLVDQSLAACVQIDGPITSHYRWAGKVEHASEYRLMIKTSHTAWPGLKEKLAKLHPYDEPEIIMLPIADVTDGYRDWVIDQTT